jgi:hypothetical protein
MSIFTGDTGGNGTAFGPLSWDATNNPGATGTFYLLPTDGAPDAAEYFKLSAGPGTYTVIKAICSVSIATDSVTYTLRLNGSDTGLTCTITPGTTSAKGSGSVAVVAGDRLSMKLSQSGTVATNTRPAVGVY